MTAATPSPAVAQLVRTVMVRRRRLANKAAAVVSDPVVIFGNIVILAMTSTYLAFFAARWLA